MGLLKKIFFVSIAVIFILIAVQINNLLEEPPLPVLDSVWWGPGDEIKVDTSIRPFKIDVPQKVIDDLNQRLKNARPLIAPLEGIQQQYGMNTELLSEIVEFWKTHYDWRQRERWLNQYPQFKTNIQGLDIHFIHVKPTKTEGVKILPLLLLHGWPGSIREFYELIPLLTTPQKGRDFVFEVIVPSLPGYGFSQGASKTGLGAPQMAVIFKNLMERLGFKKYYLQGGDWGAFIINIMSTLYPDRVLGMHSNMCSVMSPLVTFKLILGSFYPALVVDEKFQHRLYPLSSVFGYLILETGYMHLHSSKPDTIGVVLNDSPIGLAAYIIEKFTTWTNPEWKNRLDGGLKEKYSYVDLLDNVMIYWVTNSITTSVRLYAESFTVAVTEMKFASIPINVPSACARFAHELTYQPDNLLATQFKNLLHTSDIDDGGHFAAFEVPQLLSKDIWVAVDKMEKYYKGKKSS